MFLQNQLSCGSETELEGAGPEAGRAFSKASLLRALGVRTPSHPTMPPSLLPASLALKAASGSCDRVPPKMAQSSDGNHEEIQLTPSDSQPLQANHGHPEGLWSHVLRSLGSNFLQMLDIYLLNETKYKYYLENCENCTVCGEIPLSVPPSTLRNL